MIRRNCFHGPVSCGSVTSGLSLGPRREVLELDVDEADRGARSDDADDRHDEQPLGLHGAVHRYVNHGQADVGVRSVPAESTPYDPEPHALCTRIK